MPRVTKRKHTASQTLLHQDSFPDSYEEHQNLLNRAPFYPYVGMFVSECSYGACLAPSFEKSILWYADSVTLGCDEFLLEIWFEHKEFGNRHFQVLSQLNYLPIKNAPFATERVITKPAEAWTFLKEMHPLIKRYTFQTFDPADSQLEKCLNTLRCFFVYALRCKECVCCMEWHPQKENLCKVCSE